VGQRWQRESGGGELRVSVWRVENFSRGVGIRRAGLVRKGLVGIEDGGARRRLVA
jgi:hypothetical protein